MSLEALHPSIQHHVANTLGWSALRPLQEAAVAPLMAGDDALLLAPTAGGKTEAAALPLLSRMAAEQWRGPSLIYLCPLKALLNNLLPRLEQYAGWIGHTVALWHGDVNTPQRRQILRNRPDVLLTTPESLEAMLVSVNVDHASFLGGVQTVVVDEVHAFAGDDRGWHLLAVLERLSRVAGHPIQRVGLSATVGNPDELLHWLQGAQRGQRPGSVIAPDLPTPVVFGGSVPPGDIELDYVGSVPNAATVIAALHAGEKRLVFCDSRQLVEELGAALRDRGVTTFVSHASLSVDERRRAEEAFAEARDCVIVSTSTLELGIDVGDLDRVLQINAPRTVASFLQRLGRSGRRPGSARNCLFLALDEPGLLQAAGLLSLWGSGWVEPVTPPPEPRHIVAQQLLALCLQEHQVGENLWPAAWNGLPPFDKTAEVIQRYLVEQGYLDQDAGMLHIGPEAELRFGRRHFMDMTAVFTAPPQFTVLSGRTEIGRTDPALLTEEVRGPRLLLLAGRSWRVTYVDWVRRRCFVEPADSGGKARWNTSGGVAGLSFELVRAMRGVLLGADPPVRLTRRARSRLEETRLRLSSHAHPGGTVVHRNRGQLRWWTWAGYRANATLATTLNELVDPAGYFDDQHIRLRTDLTPDDWRSAVSDAPQRLCLPDVDPKALVGLKFNAALPERLAIATLSARLAELSAASMILGERATFVVSDSD
ncbi:DEAD/DEAH box helicase [Dactylosporangium siamense]|uniref:ATP-dependent helicase n=1 Tax=Dactylosporangium siamense TaxID=685454 RepID=A0A919PKM0_9ACTN|nr:DEAD/DEAH box helicase [Dactylosporangium siamense]GIG44961.1 ATP-dependent helicase [Dactylosporangium siamense]